MRAVIVAGTTIMLAGCYTTPVVMINPQTKKTVECGPYYMGLGGDFKMEGIAMRESQCIQDYKEQGYVRK